MRREDRFELQSLPEAQLSDPEIDHTAVEERDAISYRNIARKLSQKGCVEGVVTSTEDNVLAFPDAVLHPCFQRR